ncbi:MAG: hypothetical protein JNM14_00390 [Ferruginibacter sp.]|nr:hypothetical protein [Ferruginibacter sp.]
MTSTANITIYLQAVGGHFLGANAYDPGGISITLKYSGGKIKIPYNVIPHFTDDGNVSPNFTEGASSFLPIITIPQPAPAVQAGAVNYLSGDFTTVAARANIKLASVVEFAELSVNVPTTSGQPFQISQSVILNPAQPEYKIIVPVPGLYLSAGNLPKAVSVFVKMMCGCPVTAAPPASLWPANDFVVFANVTDISGGSTVYSLTYDTSQTGNSLFSAALLPGQKKIKSVTYTALQKSTANYGVLAAG